MGDRRTQRRYPLVALVSAMGCVDDNEVARSLGMSRSALKTFRERGLTERAAERWAVAAGFVAYTVWPEMVDDVIAAASKPCRGCGEPFVPTRRSHVYCAVECGRRSRGRVGSDMTTQPEGSVTSHELKTWPPFYEEVESGHKPFELRLNDRHFAVGDVLVLREFRPASQDYTGRSCVRRVTYVLPIKLIHPDLPFGWVAMGLTTDNGRSEG